MYNSKNLDIREEVSNPLADNKTGCIVFDFGAFFPYANNFSFEISLGLDKLPNQKLNHRYPNKSYYTITRKYGRKLSKVGYPYYFDFSNFEDEQKILLCVKAIIYESTDNGKDRMINAVFPLKLNLTKDKPMCALSLRFIVDKMKYEFVSYERKDGNIGYTPTYWSNIPKEDVIPLKLAYGKDDDEKITLMFDTTIEPCPNKYDDFII